MIYLFSYIQYMLYIFLIIPAYFYLRVSSIFTLWFVFLKYLNTSSITGNPQQPACPHTSGHIMQSMSSHVVEVRDQRRCASVLRCVPHLLPPTSSFQPSQRRASIVFSLNSTIKPQQRYEKEETTENPPVGGGTLSLLYVGVYTFCRQKLALIGPAAPQQKKKKRGIHLAAWLICIALKKTGSVFSQLRWQKQEERRSLTLSGRRSSWLTGWFDGEAGWMTGWLHFDVHGRAHHHTVCMAVHTNRSWSGFYVFKKQKYPPPPKKKKTIYFVYC